jgi:hypothetical protein
LPTGADRGRHQLIVAARTLEDLVLREEIHRLRGRLDLTHRRGTRAPAARLVGETGRIDASLLG